jgi:hypothetical protein
MDHRDDAGPLGAFDGADCVGALHGANAFGDQRLKSKNQKSDPKPIPNIIHQAKSPCRATNKKRIAGLRLQFFSVGGIAEDDEIRRTGFGAWSARPSRRGSTCYIHLSGGAEFHYFAQDYGYSFGYKEDIGR